MDRRTIIFVILMTTTFYVVNHFLFPPKKALDQPEVINAPIANSVILQKPENETLYVLENEYQQLVISSLNGAVAQINLPYQNAQNPNSVIRKIETDRLLENGSASKSQGSYHTYNGTMLAINQKDYYPLLRKNGLPFYYGLATTTSQPESADSYYKVKRFEKNLIELEGTTGGVKLKKIYQLPENPALTPYSFDLTIVAEEKAGDLSIATGIPEVELISGSSSPVLKYQAADSRNRQTVQSVSLPSGISTITHIQPQWVCSSNGFFALLLDPQSEMGHGFSVAQVPGNLAPTRLSQINPTNPTYPAINYPGYEAKIPFKNEKGTYKFRIFAGPLDSTVLDKNDAVFKDNYSGMHSMHGWLSFISEPFAKLLFFLMKIFYATVHSWGISIILLTIALRLMMYPLNAWSIRSTLKMQKLSPKLSSLQQKHKNDPKKAQMEMMALYKEHKVNPLGGCFPLLIQMPFLIGMFELLKTTFELRGASFIPGWIDNLTAPDVVFSWKTPLWLIGNSLHLLPLLLGAVMYWQQKISSVTPKNPKALTDQQKQQKMMGHVMVVLFTVLFYNFPSGLNLYWLSSMLLAILQQWWMTKRRGA